MQKVVSVGGLYFILALIDGTFRILEVGFGKAGRSSFAF